MNIEDFYPGTTITFSGEFKVKGALRDITSDTITLRIKRKQTDTNEESVLEYAADKVTEGADGIALFVVTDAMSQIPEGEYYCDITWEISGLGERVPHSQMIIALARTSDAS